MLGVESATESSGTTGAAAESAEALVAPCLVVTVLGVEWGSE
jgi:hypothetical protein